MAEEKQKGSIWTRDLSDVNRKHPFCCGCIFFVLTVAYVLGLLIKFIGWEWLLIIIGIGVVVGIIWIIVGITGK